MRKSTSPIYFPKVIVTILFFWVVFEQKSHAFERSQEDLRKPFEFLDSFERGNQFQYSKRRKSCNSQQCEYPSTSKYEYHDEESETDDSSENKDKTKTFKKNLELLYFKFKEIEPRISHIYNNFRNSTLESYSDFFGEKLSLSNDAMAHYKKTFNLIVKDSMGIADTLYQNFTKLKESSSVSYLLTTLSHVSNSINSNKKAQLTNYFSSISNYVANLTNRNLNFQYKDIWRYFVSQHTRIEDLYPYFSSFFKDTTIIQIRDKMLNTLFKFSWMKPSNNSFDEKSSSVNLYRGTTEKKCNKSSIWGQAQNKKYYSIISFNSSDLLHYIPLFFNTLQTEIINLIFEQKGLILHLVPLYLAWNIINPTHNIWVIPLYIFYYYYMVPVFTFTSETLKTLWSYLDMNFDINFKIFSSLLNYIINVGLFCMIISIFVKDSSKQKLDESKEPPTNQMYYASNYYDNIDDFDRVRRYFTNEQLENLKKLLQDPYILSSFQQKVKTENLEKFANGYYPGKPFSEFDGAPNWDYRVGESIST